MNNKSLSHIDSKGNAQMVDITSKPNTQRLAIASAEIHMEKKSLELIQKGHTKKGDVYTTAKIAGIQAAKKTAELIPLCHSLLINDIQIEIIDDKILGEEQHGLTIISTVQSNGKTGVEMEALVAVTTASLTIYDMTKAIDKSMKITNIHLVEKRGGQTGDIVTKQN